MSKYKYEDKVWVYVDPHNLVDDKELPVFECEVSEVEVMTKSSYGGESSFVTRYTLSLGFDDLHRKEEEIFPTRQEAIKSGLVNYKTSIEGLERKLERYKHVYTLMEQEIID